jgi:teichoic acid transport system permease protein
MPDSAATSAAELAASYGLQRASRRPPLADYLRELWDRRHFVIAFARARTVTHYSGARLGQLWQVLTPLLNAALYYFVFGKLLGTHRGVTNFVAFLCLGMFVFSFLQRSVNACAKAVSGNLSLIRALHFPRACLPLGYVLVQWNQLAVSMGVGLVIVLLTGEPITLKWLMLIPCLLLASCFVAGVGLLVARLGAQFPDLNQLLPFVLRTWLYVSGVFYSIDQAGFIKAKPNLADVLYANPATVYIEITRASLMKEFSVRPHAWEWGIGWALGALVVGFLVFWQAEKRYGRG